MDKQADNLLEVRTYILYYKIILFYLFLYLFNFKNCWNCGRKANETCGGCLKAKYCSQFCQHKNWEWIHHKVIKIIS